MLPLLAACMSDDDDDNGNGADTTTDPAPEATSAVEEESTPEDEATSEDESTPDIDSSPTAAETPEDSADATGTTDDAGSTPESTPDTMTTPDTESTPDGTGTPETGEGDDPFGDLAELTSDVPNFTLDYTGTFDNVPDETGATFSADMEMMLEQSEADIYHLRLMTTGDDEVEIEMWSLGDATYIAESGEEPVELPAGTATGMAPTDALLIVPPVETLDAADEVGQEDIGGRSATHYEVDPEDAALILMSQGVTFSNPEGDMDIWIDDELDIILQMTADITFENEDGSEGAIEMNYMVSDINETDDIEAPGS